MTNEDYPYPADRFDEEADRLTYTGVHRERSGLKGSVLALIVVGALLLVLLLAFLIPAIMPSKNAPVADKPAATAPAADKTGDNKAPAAEEPKVDKKTKVKVLNAAGINGMAGAWKKVLNDDGWTSIDTGNAKTRSQEAVVYYKEAKDKASAEAVAKKVGAGSVKQSADYPDPITFVAVKRP